MMNKLSPEQLFKSDTGQNPYSATTVRPKGHGGEICTVKKQ